MLRAKKRLTGCFSLTLTSTILGAVRGALQPWVAPAALIVLALGLGWSLRTNEAWAANDVVSPFRLVAVWTGAGQNQELKSWTLNELFQFKKAESRERDPISGKLVKWKGVLLSLLLEKVLGDLTPENRAQVDLVVLKGEAGTRALIPRAMITKYPVMLALQTQTPDSAVADPAAQSRGPVYSVVPWSTRPKILDEGLPLENYFVPHLAKIEFTSYKDRFSPLFLKRRTDPSAMRGEKLFVQNCVGCHAEGDTKVYKFGQIGPATAAEHPAMKAALRLSDKDKKSLVSYLNAYKGETAEATANAATNATANAATNAAANAATNATLPK